MSFLSLLNQKTYPAELLRPEVILIRRYLRKGSICMPTIRPKMHQAFFFFIFATICPISAEWM